MRSARRKSRNCKDFIARFSAGTRSAQATSRKKEVERLQTTELARSNIARPYIRFQMEQNSGTASAGHQERGEILRRREGDRRIFRRVDREEKIALMGRNGTGKTTLLKSLMATAPGYIDDADRDFPVDGGQVNWGHNVAVRIFRAGPHRIDHARA